MHKFLVRQQDANLWGALFGGLLMQELDIAGYFSVREFLQGVDYDYITTASFENIIFKRPAFPSDILLFYDTIVKVGNTSITIQLSVIREDIHGNKEEIANAIGVYVCMKNNKPVKHNKGKSNA